MNLDEMKLLFTYNTWADNRILAAAAKVTEAQYAAPTDLGLGFGSLRGTLVHLLDSFYHWRVIFEGFPIRGLAEMTEADFPTWMRFWCVGGQKNRLCRPFWAP